MVLQERDFRFLLYDPSQSDCTWQVDSVQTTLDPTSFPIPNLIPSDHSGQHFLWGKNFKLHEKKYYPKDLGKPMKSEYFQSLSLF